MLYKLFNTKAGYSMVLLRLPLAVSMIVHGYGKVMNIAGFINYCDSLGIGPVGAYLGAAGEFLGGLGILFGCLSRIAGFGVACTMLVAMLSRHLFSGYGYLMNWHGALPYGAEGYEFHTLAIGMALTVMLAGPGVLSVDYLIAKQMEKSQVKELRSMVEQQPTPVHSY